MGHTYSKYTPSQMLYHRPSSENTVPYILGISVLFLLLAVILSLGISSFITVGQQISYYNDGDTNNCVKVILENVDPVVLNLCISFICISFFINLVALGYLIYKSWKIAQENKQ